MNSLFGVEANPLIFEIPKFGELLSLDPKVIEIHDCLYIYENETDALQAKELLEEAGLFEEIHPLYTFHNGQEGENFFDYGFNSENRVYLYKDLLTAITLHGEDSTLLEMAKYQLSEHLTYSTWIDKQQVLFIDRQLDQLVLGITNAYICEARFLDLDKWKKNL